MSFRYVDNLLGVWDQAADIDKQEGALWYPNARDTVVRIAHDTKHEPWNVCVALSALSPRRRWDQNVALTRRLCEGEDPETLPTLKLCARKAAEALRTGDINVLGKNAPKTRAFALAIWGQHWQPVVDSWILKSMQYPRFTISTKEYNELSCALKLAAHKSDVRVTSFQATVWIMVRNVQRELPL